MLLGRLELVHGVAVLVLVLHLNAVVALLGRLRHATHPGTVVRLLRLHLSAPTRAIAQIQRRLEVMHRLLWPLLLLLRLHEGELIV